MAKCMHARSHFHMFKNGAGVMVNLHARVGTDAKRDQSQWLVPEFRLNERHNENRTGRYALGICFCFTGYCQITF